MDLNQQLGKIVEGLIADITANVMVQVDSVMAAAINNKLATYDFSTFIKDAAAAAFEKRVSEYQIDPRKLEGRIVEKINITIDEVQANTAALISSAVEKQVAHTNFHQAMTDAVSTVIADRLQEHVFPVGSIKANAINFNDFVLSGNYIQGGIIQNFGSTGIDDQSTRVALTILDDTTVVENNLLTKDLTVQGSMTINGEFVVNGSVPVESAFYKNLVNTTETGVLQKMDVGLFDNYSALIFNKIRTEGLDLSKITVNGKEAIKDNSLGTYITESNLQKVGQLKELQVSGETLLSESLYTTKGRIGINTIEPGAALSVWDDEIEILVSKRQKDTGAIGTPRAQKLILYSNNKDNIILNDNGSTTINDLYVGSMRFTASDQPPNYVSEKGHVVWNANPSVGGPLGWICLGAANWANFGIID
jgi:hypothetical protein